MEATKEEGGLLSTIRPPRLEDAGLEDCALSQESIKEAFFKAANSLRSWAGTDVESDSDDHCLEDKTLPPKNQGLSDSLIGVAPTSDPPASCSNEKGGGLTEVLGDEVCVGGGDGNLNGEKGCDKVIGSKVPEASSGRSCVVDVLQGLKIDDEGIEEEREGEKPILAEGFL